MKLRYISACPKVLLEMEVPEVCLLVIMCDKGVCEINGNH